MVALSDRLSTAIDDRTYRMSGHVRRDASIAHAV
jgi:hypothetical protein